MRVGNYCSTMERLDRVIFRVFWKTEGRKTEAYGNNFIEKMVSKSK